MNLEEEMRELERLFQESPYGEFLLLQRSSKWGEPIRKLVIKRIRTGQADAIEDGILYLEVSPRYHRSGYHKAMVASALKSATLTSQQKQRLRTVILAAIDSDRVGPEFNEYARLTVRVANAKFLAMVDERLKTSKGWTKKRLIRIANLCKQDGLNQRGER